MTSVKWCRCHPRLRRLAQSLVIVVPLAFLFWTLAANWQAVRSYGWRVNGVRSGLAVLCLTTAFGLLPLVTRQVLSALGHSISYVTAYRIYFIAQLAKYLPGGLWIVPGRVLVLSQIGVNVVVSSVSIIIESCVLLVSGAVVFLLYFLYSGTQSISGISVFSIFLATAFLLGLHPKVFNPALRWLLAHLGYTDVTVNMSARKTASVLLIDLIFWLMAGTGFFLLVSSIQTIPLNRWLVFVSALSMSWILGFLVFLTPGGLGVREGALALLLVPFLPTPLPAVVALLARLWWTVAELVSVAIAVLVR